jgi:hypothetical protein
MKWKRKYNESRIDERTCNLWKVKWMIGMCDNVPNSLILLGGYRNFQTQHHNWTINPITWLSMKSFIKTHISNPTNRSQTNHQHCILLKPIKKCIIPSWVRNSRDITFIIRLLSRGFKSNLRLGKKEDPIWTYATLHSE